jgi:hypothetical protein
MGAARNAVPKWVDPDLPWDDTELPVSNEEPALKAVVDRFHNHEDMSPEAMAMAIAELRETVKSLDGRLAEAQTEAAEAANATKGLGSNMVKMGDALSKRVRTLEEEAEAERAAERARAQAQAAAAAAAKRANRSKMVRLSLGLAGALVVVMAAVLLLWPHAAPTTQAAAQPAQLLYSPDAPAPAAAAPNASGN